MAQLPETWNTESQNQREIIPSPELLYIWGINKNVTDSQLYDHFNQAAQVVSVSISRDEATDESLGCAYVQFNNSEDATKALNELNNTRLNNKRIKIMCSTRYDNDRRENAAKVFVKNIDEMIDKEQLCDIFSTFGNVISCNVATDGSGQSKSHGYVKFENEESAQKAIDNLNGRLINDRELYVTHYLLKGHRKSLFSGNNSAFTNLFVNNLSESLTEVDLKNIFGEYGTIIKATVMRNEDGSSKCYGFVNFGNPDSAAKAMDALKGKIFDGKKLYVTKYMNKPERELKQKKHHDRVMKEAADNDQSVTVYISNMHNSIMDEKLRELFSEFGTIISYKVLKDPNGISRGIGWVEFSAPEEANQALLRMNGEMVAGRPLFLFLSCRKNQTSEVLQANFSQMFVTTAPPVAPHMPLYPAWAPASGPQFLYGQPPPVITPQAEFGYQQQLVPMMTCPPFPNFPFPVVQQGQHDPRSGGHQGAGPSQQPKREPPMLYQQALTLQLKYCLPGQHRAILGQIIYPIVRSLEPDSAGEVTGMILDMDRWEVLHLIESRDALEEKVAEAMSVLRSHMAPEDQRASPSTN